MKLAERLALLLALAILLGVAFEEICKRDQLRVSGRIRIFPLVGRAEALLYLIEPQRGLAFGAGLLAVAAWACMRCSASPRRRPILV